MNLHEYQAKGVLKSFGVNIQEGIAIDDASKAVDTAKELTAQTGTEWYVIKLRSTQVEEVKVVVLN